eukprot:jgi/Mesvir1/11824/Mv00176-RA.1
MDSKTLDTVVGFLAKRDGIDKVVKLARYVGRLQAYYLLKRDAQSVWGKAFDQFENHCAIGRKAYRLGKFLGPLSELKSVNRRDKLLTLFTLISCVGEAVYLFLDQFVWLSKTGLLRKSVQDRVCKPSATGELLGYLGTIALNLLKLVRVQEKRATLIAIAEARRRQMEANHRTSGHAWTHPQPQAGALMDAAASKTSPVASAMTATATSNANTTTINSSNSTATAPLPSATAAHDSDLARLTSAGAVAAPMLTDAVPAGSPDSCAALDNPPSQAFHGNRGSLFPAAGAPAATASVPAMSSGVPALPPSVTALSAVPSFVKPPAGGKDVDMDIAKAIDAMGDELLTRSLAMVQCVADAAFPIADLRDKQGMLSDKGLLSVCGILSAVISIHKNWRACRK